MRKTYPRLGRVLLAVLLTGLSGPLPAQVGPSPAPTPPNTARGAAQRPLQAPAPPPGLNSKASLAFFNELQSVQQAVLDYCMSGAHLPPEQSKRRSAELAAHLAHLQEAIKASRALNGGERQILLHLRDQDAVLLKKGPEEMRKNFAALVLVAARALDAATKSKIGTEIMKALGIVPEPPAGTAPKTPPPMKPAPRPQPPTVPPAPGKKTQGKQEKKSPPPAIPAALTAPLLAPKLDGGKMVVTQLKEAQMPPAFRSQAGQGLPVKVTVGQQTYFGRQYVIQNPDKSSTLVLGAANPQGNSYMDIVKVPGVGIAMRIRDFDGAHKRWSEVYKILNSVGESFPPHVKLPPMKLFKSFFNLLAPARTAGKAAQLMEGLKRAWFLTAPPPVLARVLWPKNIPWKPSFGEIQHTQDGGWQVNLSGLSTAKDTELLALSQNILRTINTLDPQKGRLAAALAKFLRLYGQKQPGETSDAQLVIAADKTFWLIGGEINKTGQHRVARAQFRPSLMYEKLCKGRKLGHDRMALMIWGETLCGAKGAFLFDGGNPLSTHRVHRMGDREKPESPFDVNHTIAEFRGDGHDLYFDNSADPEIKSAGWFSGKTRSYEVVVYEESVDPQIQKLAQQEMSRFSIDSKENEPPKQHNVLWRGVSWVFAKTAWASTQITTTQDRIGFNPAYWAYKCFSGQAPPELDSLADDYLNAEIALARFGPMPDREKDPENYRKWCERIIKNLSPETLGYLKNDIITRLRPGALAYFGYKRENTPNYDDLVFMEPTFEDCVDGLAGFGKGSYGRRIQATGGTFRYLAGNVVGLYEFGQDILTDPATWIPVAGWLGKIKGLLPAIIGSEIALKTARFLPKIIETVQGSKIVTNVLAPALIPIANASKATKRVLEKAGNRVRGSGAARAAQKTAQVVRASANKHFPTFGRGISKTGGAAKTAGGYALVRGGPLIASQFVMWPAYTDLFNTVGQAWEQQDLLLWTKAIFGFAMYTKGLIKINILKTRRWRNTSITASLRPGQAPFYRNALVFSHHLLGPGAVVPAARVQDSVANSIRSRAVLPQEVAAGAGMAGTVEMPFIGSQSRQTEENDNSGRSWRSRSPGSPSNSRRQESKTPPAPQVIKIKGGVYNLRTLRPIPGCVLGFVEQNGGNRDQEPPPTNRQGAYEVELPAGAKYAVYLDRIGYLQVYVDSSHPGLAEILDSKTDRNKLADKIAQKTFKPSILHPTKEQITWNFYLIPAPAAANETGPDSETPDEAKRKTAMGGNPAPVPGSVPQEEKSAPKPPVIGGNFDGKGKSGGSGGGGQEQAPAPNLQTPDLDQSEGKSEPGIGNPPPLNPAPHLPMKGTAPRPSAPFGPRMAQAPQPLGGHDTPLSTNPSEPSVENAVQKAGQAFDNGTPAQAPAASSVKGAVAPAVPPLGSFKPTNPFDKKTKAPLNDAGSLAKNRSSGPSSVEGFNTPVPEEGGENFSYLLPQDRALPLRNPKPPQGRDFRFPLDLGLRVSAFLAALYLAKYSEIGYLAGLQRRPKTPFQAGPSGDRDITAT